MLYHYPAGYPTRAREDVDARELVEIGSIEADTHRIRISAGSAELSWWIERPTSSILGLIEETA